MRKLISLMIPLLLASNASAFAQSGDVESFCKMLAPQNVQVFDWTNWRNTVVGNQNLADAPFYWDASHNIWQGYNSDEPMYEPHDVYKHWSVTLMDADGSQQWIYILDSQTTPITDYIYVFDHVQPSTDHHGNHYGIHPCRAFAADGLMIERWIQAAYNPLPS